MVTAGIYMIARTHELWHIAENASVIAAWIGALTAFFAATIALVQTDLKKILAYSTISQLGYMMLGVGVGAYGAAIFHLTTHAFFKALLFLAAGSVMHATHGELDIRKMGGLQDKMPTTFRTFLIGAAALAGIPRWRASSPKMRSCWARWSPTRFSMPSVWSRPCSRRSTASVPSLCPSLAPRATSGSITMPTKARP